MNKSIAIVVPCFNEELRLPREYWKSLVSVESNIHWLFVDDGSSDGTTKVLKEICDGTLAQILKLSANQGKGNAIREGFIKVIAQDLEINFIGYLDSDGAFSINDVMRLAKMANESSFDAIISSRVSLSGRLINRKSSRHYLGRLIATYLTRNWEDAPYDTQSGYKLFANTESFRESIKVEFSTKWFVDVELITRIGVSNKGLLNLWEEPLLSWKDVDGSKLKARKICALVVEIVFARRQVLKLLMERAG